MKTRSDRLALAISLASAIAIVGLLLARLPVAVDLRIEGGDGTLRAIARVAGLGAMLEDRLIWARPQSGVARHLTVHADEGTRSKARGGEQLVFASRGESIQVELFHQKEEAEGLVRRAYFDRGSPRCVVPLE